MRQYGSMNKSYCHFILCNSYNKALSLYILVYYVDKYLYIEVDIYERKQS